MMPMSFGENLSSRLSPLSSIVGMMSYASAAKRRSVLASRFFVRVCCEIHTLKHFTTGSFRFELRCSCCAQLSMTLFLGVF
jgi:hypothetical protein